MSKKNDKSNDKGYKFLLSSKKIFVELLRSFVHIDGINNIDEESIIKIPQSFILQDFKEKEADIVYRLKLKEQEVIFYVLLELQTKVDFSMPYRLLQYMLEVWRYVLKNEQKKNINRKTFKLPVIVPMVLYNGKCNWTACRSFKETLNGYKLFSEYVLDFKYILIDVNRFKQDELLKLKNTIASVFLVEQSKKYR